MLNNGNMLGTALNLANGFVGIGLNALGMRDQKRKAEQYATEFNATRQYAE